MGLTFDLFIYLMTRLVTLPRNDRRGFFFLPGEMKLRLEEDLAKLFSDEVHFYVLYLKRAFLVFSSYFITNLRP